MFIDEETKEMLQSFASETFESLDKAEPFVEDLALENNSESVNTIFRVFHTIKGISGFFGMEKISGFTHEGEALLDLIRKSGKVQSQDTITLIYSCFDLLRRMIANVQKTGTDAGFETETEQLVQQLRERINLLSSPDKGSVEIKEEKEKQEEQRIEVKEEKILEVSKEIEVPTDEELDAKEKEILIESKTSESELINDDMISKFISHTVDALNEAERCLIDLETTADKMPLIEDIFRHMHNIKGNSGFFNFREISEIAGQTETILDNLRSGSLQFHPGINTFLLDQIDELRQKVAQIKVTTDKPKQPAKPVEKKPQQVEEKVQVTTPQKVEEPQVKETVPPPKIETETKQEESKPQLSEKPEPAPIQKKETPEIKSEAQIQRKDIRVDTTKLDKLFDLVGELITIEAMISQSPDLVGLELPHFTRSANMLNKITRELQEISMVMRMTPLEGQFNKMKRLVRDLSIKSKKKIELKISGAETEMDKNVIEEISDPLVHIIRNAIDHGIETPEERIKLGKDETGHLHLSAGYEGNEILISIEDDGRGLDRDKILKKAIDRGLVKTSIDKLTDRDIWNFIFEPGFSTAEKVTEISGRGVGMDVVKRNLEKLRGRIVVNSKPGKGTTITLYIPLTLAIMDSMIVQVGDTKYAIPTLSIYEAFQPREEDITITMDGLELVKVRKDIYPVIRLHEILKKKPLKEKLSNGILILCESRERKACIFVDDIVGQQQTVVKGLSDYLSRVNNITGCMIQGNGEVGLILDIDSILNSASN